MLGICDEDTSIDNIQLPTNSIVSDTTLDGGAIGGSMNGVNEKEEKNTTRHVVSFSHNFKIDEADYVILEEILRDSWLFMESNGFYCENTLDAARSLVKTTQPSNPDKNARTWKSLVKRTKPNENDEDGPCEYRIKSLKLPPFMAAVPYALLKLDALETLDLSDNINIEFLPPWIGDLPNLKHLNLSHTGKLRELPEEIGLLTKLERLELTDSGITMLPKTLHQLKSLKILDLRGCENIEVIPSGIGALTNLEKLDLYSMTKLQRLPEEICKLKKLNKLNLAYSNILYLPFSIGELDSLKELDLSSTKHLKAIPDDICKLQKLNRLDLSYSKISSLPAKMGQLKQLEYLSLHQCRKLRRVPDSVRKLERSIAFREAHGFSEEEAICGYRNPLAFLCASE